MNKNFSTGKGIAVLGVCGLIGFTIYTTGDTTILWVLLLLLIL